MDPIALILAAVEAAAGADDPKAAIADLLTKVKALAGGAPAPEPDGDELPMAEAPMPPAKLPEEGADKDKGPDAEMARTRARMKRDANELTEIKNDALRGAKAGLIDGLRARLPGHTGLPGVEAKISGAATYKAAKELAELAELMGGGQTRARSGVVHNAAEGTGGGDPEFTAESLKAEGFGASFVADLIAEQKVNPRAAAATLRGGRARLAQSVNPWAAQPGKAS